VRAPAMWQTTAHRWPRPRRRVVALVGLAVLLLSACQAASAVSPKAERHVDPHVHVVGDSLSLLGEQQIRPALIGEGWSPVFNAVPGSTTISQDTELYFAAPHRHPVTVVELGTNDAIQIALGNETLEQADATISAALDRFADRCVVWVNPDRDPQRRGADIGAQIDEILAREAALRPSLHIADFASVLAEHPEYLVADRTHLTTDGYRAMATLVATTLRACA
jgi:hypothetical protein